MATSEASQIEDQLDHDARDGINIPSSLKFFCLQPEESSSYSTLHRQLLTLEISDHSTSSG
ncbi:hypothetical protein KFK09_020013 [Dendrobium nobile]|uniref:Uncharacterized protein n=1 Tax=Dendrobium nobile TaxID=94219 RepID=A0A8T3ATT7_DENNO|nr:hypothetical protein KFK09_020013 [Dendrobium nobile]